MTWPEGSIERPKFQETGAKWGGWRCVVCGRVTGSLRSRWIEDCKRGHPHRCPLCGRRFSTAHGLTMHAVQRRRGHAGCLERWVRHREPLHQEEP